MKWRKPHGETLVSSREDSDTIIALAICRRDSFRGRARSAMHIRLTEYVSGVLQMGMLDERVGTLAFIYDANGR